jgi:hypothetical protein
MASVSPDLTVIPQDVQDTLSNLVKPKFNAYFAFTPPAMCARSIHGRGADGATFYTYPDGRYVTMIALHPHLRAATLEHDTC